MKTMKTPSTPKTLSTLRRYLSNKSRSDEGADVLMVALIVFPLIIAAVGFALDITKNTYLDNAYDSMAQAASNIASNERNIRGELTASSAEAFVREYMRQRGDDTSHLSRAGVQSRETLAYRPERCEHADLVEVRDQDGNDLVDVTFPHIRIDYTSLRAQGGGNFGEVNFVSDGGSVPNMSSYNPSGSYVMTVEVYDVANNFFLGILGQDCQVFRSEVSSTVVLEDQDYRR